jgi:serine/threonine protein kinase/tetratricopeptide (TPR) repeat protein
MTKRERIGKYRIERLIGEGGMGVVWEARDESLDRPLAVKMLHDSNTAAAHSRERFLREARAAARVNHPHICQVYEVGEDGGALFIAMELLEGETLATRLSRGPCSVGEAIPILLAMLGALEALHQSGIVHRDLKPTNVFLTPHGVKLLDFGLARDGLGRADESAITQSGTLLGTPRYMSPEQITGGAVDARADLFAAAAILFEMLAGRPAFDGRTLYDVLHQVTHGQPPALVGSAAIAAVDRVLQRALSKKPALRPASAGEMAAELRECLAHGDDGTAARARALTRIIALPFRILRPDDETGFLAFSLPDAVSASLSHLDSVVVRSAATAARFSSEAPDLEAIARETEVDAVLLGSLLRAGQRIRVTTQLVEAPSGTVVVSHTVDATLDDIFQVQDDLARRIVESLALPLTSRERERMQHDAPRSPRAYALYLRANKHYQQYAEWSQAFALYEECLAEDPNFAPAWARIGRILRVLAKYGTEGVEEKLVRAEAAFRRALELNPDLSLAHREYASLEDERGRGRDAMVRLLGRVSARNNDAELYSALCHSLRYVGLLEPSVVAHQKAKRFDPSVRTSVTFTHYFLGDFQAAVDTDEVEPRYNSALALYGLGKIDEAIALVDAWEHDAVVAAGPIVAGVYRSMFAGDRVKCESLMDALSASGFQDPEGWFLMGRCLVRVGSLDRGLDIVGRACDSGFCAHPILRRDPWFDPVRGRPDFQAMMTRSEARRRDAIAAYEAARGEEILGVPTRR